MPTKTTCSTSVSRKFPMTINRNTRNEHNWTKFCNKVKCVTRKQPHLHKIESRINSIILPEQLRLIDERRWKGRGRRVHLTVEVSPGEEKWCEKGRKRVAIFSLQMLCCDPYYPPAHNLLDFLLIHIFSDVAFTFQQNIL